VSGPKRRVVHVQEVALVGDFAVLGGYPAWFLAGVLTRHVPGGIDALIAKSGVRAELRADILRAVDALEEAGAAWRLAQAVAGSASTSGSADGELVVGDVPSERGDRQILSARDAASCIGVTDRQIRALATAGALPGSRDSGGRWWFRAEDVNAERARREAAA
jgi:hypothetical protein